MTTTRNTVFISCGIVFWQFLARVSNIWFSPSYIFNSIANVISYITRYIGRVFAIISSFILHIKVEEWMGELYFAIFDILQSLSHIVVSIFGFAYGYTNALIEYGWNTSRVGAGATIILVMISTIIILLFHFSNNKLYIKHITDNVISKNRITISSKRNGISDHI